MIRPHESSAKLQSIGSAKGMESEDTNRRAPNLIAGVDLSCFPNELLYGRGQVCKLTLINPPLVQETRRRRHEFNRRAPPGNSLRVLLQGGDEYIGPDLTRHNGEKC